MFLVLKGTFWGVSKVHWYLVECEWVYPINVGLLG